jgi:predicted transposase YdaD
MKTAHKNGKAEGLAEGEAKDPADENTKTARKLKADGLTAAVIAKYTGLNIEEIDAM